MSSFRPLQIGDTSEYVVFCVLVETDDLQVFFMNGLKRPSNVYTATILLDLH